MVFPHNDKGVSTVEMNLENIRLNEKSETQKVTRFMIHVYERYKTEKNTERK